jgi:hypothetical protein
MKKGSYDHQDPSNFDAMVDTGGKNHDDYQAENTAGNPAVESARY